METIRQIMGGWLMGLVILSISISMGWAEAPASPELYNRAEDVHGFTVFMEEGGWCWYQDPRAIIHNGYVIMGSVQGHGDGSALIGVYDLKQQKRLGNFVANAKFDHDDHNCPVFYSRPDGSVLAMYALHSRDKLHRYRISDPFDYTKWGPEEQIDYSGVFDRNDNVTYMNLFPLSKEGKLYNFFRGIEFNPTLVTSADHGTTWGQPVHFIKSEVKGRQRPYARYVGNGADTVHVSFTDGHPRNVGNSIYYATFRDGKFYKADGTFIKDLKKDGPLLPSEAECVYTGSGQATDGRHGQSAPNSAWTSSMSLDEKGCPHIGYTLYLSNDDHRYRIASWDGKKWIDREVAYAGKCLYTHESSYTGLITLDPMDPTAVFISTDVDPTTGKDSGGKHEIYRATVGADDDVASITWTAVSTDSPVRNIRPVVLRDGDTRVVLWNRGEFRSYTSYQMDSVGIVEKVE